MASGIRVMEWFKIASGLGWPLDRSYRAFASRIVEVAINAEQGLGIVFQNTVSMFSQEIRLVTSHEILMALGYFTLGFQMNSKKPDLLGTYRDGGIQNASLHREFLWAIVCVDGLVGQGSTSALRVRCHNGVA